MIGCVSENVNVPQWGELCKWECSYRAKLYRDRGLFKFDFGLPLMADLRSAAPSRGTPSTSSSPERDFPSISSSLPLRPGLPVSSAKKLPKLH